MGTAIPPLQRTRRKTRTCSNHAMAATHPSRLRP
jgi:hypothetical protein